MASTVKRVLDPADLFSSGKRLINFDLLIGPVAKPVSPIAGVGDRTVNVEDRKAKLEASASAAGAKRIENDLDLLGAPKKRIKERYASRILLGE